MLGLCVNCAVPFSCDLLCVSEPLDFPPVQVMEYNDLFLGQFIQAVCSAVQLQNLTAVRFRKMQFKRCKKMGHVLFHTSVPVFLSAASKSLVRRAALAAKDRIRLRSRSARQKSRLWISFFKN